MSMRIRSPISPHLISQAKHIAFMLALAFTGLAAPDAAMGVENQACPAFAVLSRDAMAGPLSTWLEALDQCQNDASFLATLGHKLNQEGRYLEATEHLERALLLDAGLKEAALSYAIALAGIGETQASQALLDELLADPSLPPQLRPVLLRQRSWRSATALQTRFSFGAHWGHDNNLLSASNLSELSLTFPGQIVLLPLDPSYLARPGSYYRTDARFEMYRLQANGTRWDLIASLRNRHSPVEYLAGSTQADLLVERSQAPVPVGSGADAASLGHYVNMLATVLSTHTGSRYDGLAVSAGAVMGWNQGWAASCRTRLGVEMQQRNFKNNNLLSGRYTGFDANLTCEPPGKMQGLLSLKLGRDVPDNDERPGGDQRQYALRVAAMLPLAVLDPHDDSLFAGFRSGAFGADFEAGFYQDSIGYSPLLESGRARKMVRYTTRLEYQHPFTRHSYWAAGFEATSQRSNISLFQVESHGPYLQWRGSW